MISPQPARSSGRASSHEIVERHGAPGGAGALARSMISCGNHGPIFARMVLGSRRVPR
jgi:hypothetical protein